MFPTHPSSMSSDYVQSHFYRMSMCMQWSAHKNPKGWHLDSSNSWPHVCYCRMVHPERPWKLCTTFCFTCLMCFFICILCNPLYNKLVNVFPWVLWVTQLHSWKPKRGLWEAQCIATHTRINNLGLVTDIWIELGRGVSLGDWASNWNLMLTPGRWC
jgi:hypothetical protein